MQSFKNTLISHGTNAGKDLGDVDRRDREALLRDLPISVSYPRFPSTASPRVCSASKRYFPPLVGGGTNSGDLEPVERERLSAVHHYPLCWCSMECVLL